MKKIMTAIAAGALTLSMAACNTPGERAVGGAAIGGAGGAIVGASTAPRGPACPYGTYQDVYGNVYCR